VATADADGTNAAARIAGCVAAFETEVDFVYRALRRYGVSGADAEDLAQEVFLVMWRRWSDYDPGRPLRPWLIGIAFRVASDFRRRRRPEVPLGFVDAEDDAGHPEDELAAGRARALVRRALGSLPEKQRAVLIMHELDGVPMQEIAAELDAPLTTLYSRLVSARKAFAKTVRRMAAPGAVTASEALFALERAPEPLLAPARDRVLGRVRSLAASPALPELPAGQAARRRVTSRPRLALEIAAGVALLGAAVFSLVRGSVKPARGPAPAGAAVAMAPARAAAAVALSRATPTAALLPLPASGPLEPARRELGQGLVGYWRFDDGAGSTSARDLSGNGTDCVLHGIDPTLDWVDGHAGGAINLGGKGWLECAGPRFGRSPDLTVAAWVRRTQPQRGTRVLVTRQLGSARRDHFFFGFVHDELAIASHVWNGTLRSPLPAANGGWVHVAAVHRDGTVKLFVDGKKVAERRSYAGRVVDAAAPLMIGAGVNGPDAAVTTQHFAGMIDELLVYGRPLADDEIAALAAGAQPPLSR
jgi:RNA polymerase sigma-70 factor (ECF subfamily)